MLTETVPASLLTHIGPDLGSDNSVTGPPLTAYAGAGTFDQEPTVA